MSPFLLEHQHINYSDHHEEIRVDQRPERLRDKCETINADLTSTSDTPSVLSVYHFYNTSNICMCHVPKAASTSVMRSLLILEYPEKADVYKTLPGHRLHVLKEVQNVSSDTCMQNAMTSFFITRDPYTRLYSAYVDKIFLRKFHKTAVFIDAAFNKNVPEETLKELKLNKGNSFRRWYCRMTDVSFEQFLKYLTVSQTIDTHFAPISLLCHPCSRHYDAILKQENLKEDSDYLFKKIYHDNYTGKDAPVVQDYIGESGIESQILTYYTHWRAWLEKHNCFLDRELYDSINYRLWDGLKFLGSIDTNLKFVDELFRGPVGEKLQIRNPASIFYEFKMNKIPYLSSEQREKQRREYIVKAYRDVDKAVLEKVQRLFQLDFALFDYNVDPPR